MSSAVRRLGVLGGSFDPPHLGHLALARGARRLLGLDEVRLVPARLPPHKPEGARAGGERRAALLEAAIAGEEGLAVSRVELERPGPSYTVDTLEAVAAAEPGAALWFILGSDQLRGLPGWRRPQRILSLARLAVAPRPGLAGPELDALVARVAPGRADILDLPEIAVSSTLVRERLAAGAAVADLVPAPVAQALSEGVW